jgi:hypothetical protein
VLIIAGWGGGRRCTLVNRRKRGIGAFKNGKLYLTKRYNLVGENILKAATNRIRVLYWLLYS